jgi:hypothetical protein
MELQALKMYLMSQYGVERVDALFWEIQMIILRSLLAVSQVMINDKHCFELYVSSVLLIIALFVIIFVSVSVFLFPTNITSHNSFILSPLLQVRI